MERKHPRSRPSWVRCWKCQKRLQTLSAIISTITVPGGGGSYEIPLCIRCAGTVSDRDAWAPEAFVPNRKGNTHGQ